ncbi:MAG: gliding motility-associated ABC transporter ATP-binding subunit GldA [Saprospiraceae bacterium]|nr:gliding motility-associated ABC transporter ATP-binding subunit GldA [Saprospiraceae bacterium]
MSIVVDSLSKRYGTQQAVDAISFTASDREILGFLGPNGAGKTTTMKMVTGYLEPDQGTAIVQGLDIRTHPVDAKQHLGYLPEHNPLYQDMYIQEYLLWAAGFYPIPDRKSRVREILDLVGLDREQHKKISQLSKGYRQRVGLAQALLHDPEVLILDEPTSGLDPNQLAEIRSLIRQLGQSKTIILSTHIMQEVTALCDRVIILHQGRIVADDPVSELQARLSGSSLVQVRTLESADASVFASIAGVLRCERLEGGRLFRIVGRDSTDLRPEIFRQAVRHSLTLIEMKQETRGVEEVFQQLTRNVS